MMRDHDRIRVDILGDCPEETGYNIAQDIRAYAVDNGLFYYQRFDKTTQQIVLEITAHDRLKEVEIREQHLMDNLSELADAQGISVRQLLRRMAKEE